MVPLSSLVADTRYTWRARATSGTAFGPWSSTFTFRSPLGEGIFGNVVFDSMLNGRTVGKQRGGSFIIGQGWMADSGNNGLVSGIDYDITTTSAATIEFDVTNVGYEEGFPFARDLKFLSMGDRNAFGDFGTFRFEILAYASPRNPKTSLLTAHSIVAAAYAGVCFAAAL